MTRNRVTIEVELAHATVTLERPVKGATTVTIQPPEYALDDPMARLIERARALMDAGDADAARRECRGMGRVRRTDWRTRSRLPGALAGWEPAIASVFEEVPGIGMRERRGDQV